MVIALRTGPEAARAAQTQAVVVVVVITVDRAARVL
jgi:hypothetical protein